LQAWHPRRIEAVSRLADPGVEEVRVALERDERARMPGDSLDELDVGAGGDEPRNACVPQVVEAAAGVGQPGALESGAPDAAVEVRLV
jgi:hypothetical protein